MLLGGACLAWATDNNLTQRLSHRDPLDLVRWKTLAAGACNLVVAVALGEALPTYVTIAIALTIGAVSYGLSIVLDTYALRLLGAAREAALFATAPFLGALAALPLLHEHFSTGAGAAAILMSIGVALLLSERHAHEHTHEPLEHEHVHEHDEHHQHAHEPGQSTESPHSHLHRHEPITHAHPHVSDAHHRHRH
jgi:drug/metabolite transporter (DMT)-like permease